MSVETTTPDSRAPTAPGPATATLLSPEQLARYADAIVRGCLHLGEGETLFLQGQLAHRELMVALADAGYRAGARLVEVSYIEPFVQVARVRHAADEHLGYLPPWRQKYLRAQLEPDAAIVTVVGDSEPGIYDGLPPERVAEDSMRPLRRLGWYFRALKEGRRRWVGVDWPTPSWAAQVYPELESDEAQRRLAQDLLWFCRLGPDDPPGFEGWTRHVEAMARRAGTLTELGLERLEVRGPGIDLTLRLSPGTRWLGGQELNAHGAMVAPNFPTEESFTSPDAAGTEGSFRCSRPLSFRGRVMEGIAGEFRRGRLVRLEAALEDDRDLLAAFLYADRGGDRLGEIALVDATSRIGQAERTYSNTLLDENAVAHVAFGAGFGQTRLPDPAARGRRGVNHANLHLDVMIGSDELEATGIAVGGRRVPLIRDGLWCMGEPVVPP
jgi:aminopeptidase